MSKISLSHLAARLYALGVNARLACYRNKIFSTHALKAPVISVGNITVGGTGKTPCTAYLAQFLRDQGLHVAILSRGYKRSSQGIVEVSDGENILCTSPQAGDEPYLLAQLCPGVRVVVNADRYAAGKWLEAKTKIDVFILDDGFQHIRLARALNLLLLDATEPVASYELLPAGKLREPLSALQRADAVIITRSNSVNNKDAVVALIKKYCRSEVPYYFARHEIRNFKLLNFPTAKIDLHQQPVAALSCIAKPERFVEDLQQQGLRLVYEKAFPDHHRYLPEDLISFFDSAISAGAKAIITTEKDVANFPAAALQQSALPVFAAQLQFVCDEESSLQNLIRQTLQL